MKINQLRELANRIRLLRELCLLCIALILLVCTYLLREKTTSYEYDGPGMALCYIENEEVYITTEFVKFQTLNINTFLITTTDGSTLKVRAPCLVNFDAK
jgi:hypothetical protein